MKKSIEGKQLLICLIILGSLLVFNFTLIYAQITSEGITSIVEAPDGEFTFDSIKKIYEISDSSLEEGDSATLNEKDAFRIKIKQKDYYIIIWNIDDEEVTAIFPGKRQLIFGLEDLTLVDIDQDGKLDVQLELKSIESTYVPDKKANLFIKNIVESELVPSGDYFELFDVTVRLAEEEIHNSGELGAFVIFENFGDGPSKIDIAYSIINSRDEEVYHGVDSKVVQTEDSVVKTFEFLDLPIGKYILRAEIFYGQNQTGESEQDFEIIEESFFSIFGNLLIFIGFLIILFISATHLRKRYEKKSTLEDVSEKKDRYKKKK